MMNATIDSSQAPFDAAWLDAVGVGLDEPGRALMAQAADWVRDSLRGVNASTGEPLDAHSAAVARILAELGSDAPTRAGALLSVQPSALDAPERQDPVRKAFGPEVATLVLGVRALLRLGQVAGQAQADPSAGDQKEMRDRKSKRLNSRH